MRLDVLDHGHPLSTKTLFAVIRVMSGHRAPDVVKTLRYRPDFFGSPMGAVFQEVMRGPDRAVDQLLIARAGPCIKGKGVDPEVGYRRGRAVDPAQQSMRLRRTGPAFARHDRLRGA